MTCLGIQALPVIITARYLCLWADSDTDTEFEFSLLILPNWVSELHTLFSFFAMLLHQRACLSPPVRTVGHGGVNAITTLWCPRIDWILCVHRCIQVSEHLYFLKTSLNLSLSTRNFSPIITSVPAAFAHCDEKKIVRFFRLRLCPWRPFPFR